MKEFVIIIILFCSYGITLSQNKICEYNNDNNIVSLYTICNMDTLLPKDIDVVKRIKQSITNRDLKNIFTLKKDKNFRKILAKHSRETDFSFQTISDMFKWCGIDISKKYNLAKIQLDTSFAQKNLLIESKIGRVAFFYFDKDFHSEIYLYNYVYCHSIFLDFYTLNNSILQSPSLPYDDFFDKKLIGLEETENFKIYTIPIMYKTRHIYMSVYLVE